MVAQKTRKGGTNPKPVPKETSAKISKSQTSAVPKRLEKVDDLLASVRALGGDDEDYALVKDVESDDIQEFSDHEAEVSSLRLNHARLQSSTLLLGRNLKGSRRFPQKARFWKAKQTKQTFYDEK